MNPKQSAAERAVSYIQDGMTVGLGTGSTAAYAIHALGKRFQEESLSLTCIATSCESETLGLSYGLSFAGFDSVSSFDITIDGADEVDPSFRLIKGRGGALVREKIVAAATRCEIIVVDAGKVKTFLGAHPLPVAILPYAWQWTQAKIEAQFGIAAPCRLAVSGEPFVSDDGLYILDLAFQGPLPDPNTLEQRLKTIVGVVEVGVFVGLCHHLIIGFDDGRIEERRIEEHKREESRADL